MLTGHCFSSCKTGPLISWKSNKQPTVALSSCEAEYVALAAATRESLYLTRPINGVDGHYESCVAFEDHRGTIASSKNSVRHQRSKQIDVRYRFVRTELTEANVNILYCPTGETVADVLTKPATKHSLDKFKAYSFGGL